MPPEALETMVSLMKHKDFLKNLEKGKKVGELERPKLPHHLDPEYTG